MKLLQNVFKFFEPCICVVFGFYFFCGYAFWRKGTDRDVVSIDIAEGTEDFLGVSAIDVELAVEGFPYREFGMMREVAVFEDPRWWHDGFCGSSWRLSIRL